MNEGRQRLDAGGRRDNTAESGRVVTPPSCMHALLCDLLLWQSSTSERERGNNNSSSNKKEKKDKRKPPDLMMVVVFFFPFFFLLPLLCTHTHAHKQKRENRLWVRTTTKCVRTISRPPALLAAAASAVVVIPTERPLTDDATLIKPNQQMAAAAAATRSGRRRNLYTITSASSLWHYFSLLECVAVRQWRNGCNIRSGASGGMSPLSLGCRKRRSRRRRRMNVISSSPHNIWTGCCCCFCCWTVFVLYFPFEQQMAPRLLYDDDVTRRRPHMLLLRRAGMRLLLSLAARHVAVIPLLLLSLLFSFLFFCFGLVSSFFVGRLQSDCDSSHTLTVPQIPLVQVWLIDTKKKTDAVVVVVACAAVEQGRCLTHSLARSLIVMILVAWLVALSLSPPLLLPFSSGAPPSS